MINLKFNYAPLDLEAFPTLLEKFEVINTYLELTAFFCLLDKRVSANGWDGKYTTIEVTTPLGSAASIKPLLNDFLNELQKNAVDYLQNNEDDFYSIKKSFESIIAKCSALVKKHDLENSLQYNEYDIPFIEASEAHPWQKHFPSQLRFDKNVRIDIEDHYNLRNEFYQEVKEYMESKLLEHDEKPAFPDKPYKWNGENAHLEIAELLYALLQRRITIKSDQKGSHAKLVKEFYNLFSLDDSLYHSKLQQVRKRRHALH